MAIEDENRIEEEELRDIAEESGEEPPEIAVPAGVATGDEGPYVSEDGAVIEDFNGLRHAYAAAVCGAEKNTAVSNS